MLALEVLTKLPEVIDLDTDVTKSHSCDSMTGSALIQTGVLDTAVTSTSATTDWSKPVMNGNAINHDWSQPLTTTSGSGGGGSGGGLDWGQPATKADDDELKLDWSDDDGDDGDSSSGGGAKSIGGDTKSDNDVELDDTLTASKLAEPLALATHKTHTMGDIMAQQLKFIACLKVR